jgi:hypothetical protein
MTSILETVQIEGAMTALLKGDPRCMAIKSNGRLCFAALDRGINHGFTSFLLCPRHDEMLDERFSRRSRRAEQREAKKAEQKMLEREAAGFVYFVKAHQGERRGLIKIGKSVNVPARVRQIEKDVKSACSVLLTISGYSDLEVRFHLRFHDLHVGTEWFRPGDALLSFIESERVAA